MDSRTRLANISSHQHSDVLNEPEDARLTGGTRSLTRRLLGLNVVVTHRSVRARLLRRSTCLRYPDTVPSRQKCRVLLESGPIGPDFFAASYF